MNKEDHTKLQKIEDDLREILGHRIDYQKGQTEGSRSRQSWWYSDTGISYLNVTDELLKAADCITEALAE